MSQCVYTFSDKSQGHVDMARVSFVQYGLDLFLILELQNGNLLSFWYLHALKLLLSVLTQPALVKELRQRGKVLRKPKPSYHQNTKDHL